MLAQHVYQLQLCTVHNSIIDHKSIIDHDNQNVWLNAHYPSSAITQVLHASLLVAAVCIAYVRKKACIRRRHNAKHAHECVMWLQQGQC